MDEDRVEDTCVKSGKNEVYLNGGNTRPTSTVDLNMKDVDPPPKHFFKIGARLIFLLLIYFS